MVVIPDDMKDKFIVYLNTQATCEKEDIIKQEVRTVLYGHYVSYFVRQVSILLKTRWLSVCQLLIALILCIQHWVFIPMNASGCLRFMFGCVVVPVREKLIDYMM